MHAQFLRVTTADGLQVLIPVNKSVSLDLDAPIVGPSTPNASGRIYPGQLVGFKRLDGAAGNAPSLAVISDILAWTGSNTLYELILLSPDGAAITIVSNRAKEGVVVVGSLWDLGATWDAGVNWS
jgi:hypothetical protein